MLYRNQADAALVHTERVKAGIWFGFAEVDIEIPKFPWLKFEEMLSSSSPNRFQAKLYLNT